MRAARWGQAALRADLRERIAQDSLIVLSGQLFRLGLGIISSALLARSLGPAGLSLFTIVGAATGIAATVADLGLRMSAIRHIAAFVAGGNERTARQTAGAYARLKLVASVSAVALIVVLARPLASLLNLPADRGPLLLWVGSLGLLATALSGLAATILHALRRFRPLVVMQSANVVLTVLLLSALWLREALTVPWALLVGAISAAAAALLGYRLLPSGWRAALWRSASLRGAASGRLLSFSRWIWLSNVFSILAVQVDVLLLNYLVPLPLVGIYALARNLAQKADVVNQTLHTVLLPNVSALAGPPDYRRYLRRSLARAALLGGLILLAIPLARPLILLVYGEAFAASVPIFYALLSVVLFDVLVSPLILLALPLDRPRLLALADGAQVVLLLILGITLVPRWGVYGIIVARLAGKVVGALITLLPLIPTLRGEHSS